MFRPGERVVWSGQLCTVIPGNTMGPGCPLIQPPRGLPIYVPVRYLRPLYYPQQLAPGARKDNPSYAAAIKAEVESEPNPYLEAQK